VQARSSLASRLHALGGHVARRMRRALHLGIQKAIGVVRPTTRSTSRLSPRVMSFVPLSFKY
jgi:hypothetical protein